MVSSRLFGSVLLSALVVTGPWMAPVAFAESHEHAPFGVLNLTILEKTTRETRSALLTCGPDSGTHPRPKAACAALTNSGGDFHKIPGKLEACPLIYNPTTVNAAGVFNGSPVNYTETFANACVAANATGGVFDF